MESKNLMRVRFHTKKGYSDGGQGIYSRESIVPEGRKEKYKAPKSCASKVFYQSNLDQLLTRIRFTTLLQPRGCRNRVVRAMALTSNLGHGACGSNSKWARLRLRTNAQIAENMYLSVCVQVGECPEGASRPGSCRVT